MPRRSPRSSRYGDFTGILMILAGFVGYLWTEGALTALERRAAAPGGTTFGALAEVERFMMLSRIALAAAAAGLLVLLATAIVHRRAQRRPSAPPVPPSTDG